jgi:hypothetical protein
MSKETVFKAPTKSVGPFLKETSSSIRLKTIREAANEDINMILKDIKSKKDEEAKITWVFDPTIIGPLNLLIPGSILKVKKQHINQKEEGNFQLINLVPQKEEEYNGYNEVLIYLSRPRIDLMKLVAAHITAFKEKKKKIFLYLLPRATLISEIILQDEGVYDMIQQPIGEFSADLIPIDNDLISMELSYGYKEINVVRKKRKGKRMETIPVYYF